MIVLDDEQQKQLERVLDLLEKRKDPYCRWPDCHKDIDKDQVHHSSLCIETREQIASLREWIKQHSE